MHSCITMWKEKGDEERQIQYKDLIIRFAFQEQKLYPKKRVTRKAKYNIKIW